MFEFWLKSATLFIAITRLYRKLGREAESAESCKIARDLIEKENEYNRACFEAVCGSSSRTTLLDEFSGDGGDGLERGKRCSPPSPHLDPALKDEEGRPGI